MNKPSKFAAHARHIARVFAYSGILGSNPEQLGGLIGRKDAPHCEAEYWDSSLKASFKPYINPTVATLAHARMIATLAETDLPAGRRALDIGCGGGFLAEALAGVGYDCYLGTDISRVAVDTAKRRLEERRTRYPADTRFEQSALGKGEPPMGPWDLIVFSEVLYLLDTTEAAAHQVRLHTGSLAPNGRICVALKNDGKSRAILRGLRSHLDVSGSMLFQEQLRSPAFSVRINREWPAYLIIFLRPANR